MSGSQRSMPTFTTPSCSRVDMLCCMSALLLHKLMEKHLAKVREQHDVRRGLGCVTGLCAPAQL